MIEPWEDPWAPATPAGPRRNGVEGDEPGTGESASGTRTRRWSRTAPDRDGRGASRLERDPIERLARWALPLALDTSDHLDLSGHRSTVQDLLEADPPSIRLLLWPRRGPLDAPDGPRRHTLELSLERDGGDLFVARYWPGDRRLDVTPQGRVATADADRDWFDRQLVHFVERVLSLA